MTDIFDGQHAHYQFLDEMIKRWGYLGTRKFPDGTWLVGHVKELGPDVYLHRIFGGLTDEEIDRIESWIDTPLHTSLRRFYRIHNGFDLFRSKLILYGLRRSFDRLSLTDILCNPYDILSVSRASRGLSPSGRGNIISEYTDKSLVFVEPTGEVVRIDRTHPRQSVNLWPSIEFWIESEVTRFSFLYDESGFALVDESEQLPPRFSLS